MSRSALNFALKRQLASGASALSGDAFAATDAWQPDAERLAASAYELCVELFPVGPRRFCSSSFRWQHSCWPCPTRHASFCARSYGNPRTFNLDPVLAQNIVASNYFKWELLEWPDPADLLPEAKAKVTHVEPYAPGTYVRRQCFRRRWRRGRWRQTTRR
jgi:hypothetical protein